MTGSGAGRERTTSSPAPLFGRDGEMELLQKAWRRAVERGRRVVFVAGEPGIGKTRLAFELVRGIDDEGARALLGRCSSEGLIPYQPFVEVLEGLRAVCPPTELARHLRDVPSGELAKLVPALVKGLPGSPAPLPSDPRAERHRLFTAVTTLLTRAAQANPTIVVLEDLHWADQPTLRMLRYVLRAPPERGLLVIGTYRDTELGPEDALSELLADLRRDDLAARVTLPGISEEAVVNLARAVSGEALEVGRARELHRATGGNPLFVRELARDLDAQAVPGRLSDAVASRLEALEPDTRLLLTVASAIGPQFELDLVEEVSGMEAMAAVDAAEQASAAGLIEEVAPTVGVFAHAVVRAAVYEGLNEPQRSTIHLGIGEALARRADANLAELAHHFLVAGDERGASYAIRAGHEALERFAYETATDMWERALKVLGPPRDRDGLELLLALADAHWRSGEFQLSRERYGEAAELAARLELPDLLAVAALGFGARMGFGAGMRDDRLVALLEQSLESLPEGDEPLRARVLARLATALVFSERRQRIPELCDQATAMARRIGDDGVLAAVLANVHWALWGPGNARARLEMADEVVRLSREAGGAALEVDGRLWRAVDLLELGDAAAADAELDAASSRAQDTRDHYQRWVAASLRALRVLMAGRVEDAEALAAQALELGQRDANPNALQIYGMQLAGVRLEQGRFAEFEEPLKAFIAEYPAVATWRCALAFLYAAAGQAEQARLELKGLGASGFTDLPRDLFWLAGLALAGEAAALAASLDDAHTLYTLLEPHGRQHVVIVTGLYWGSTSRVLGLLARALGRTGDAARHFEEAIDQNGRVGALVWRARSQVEYAELLDQLGERERAQALVKEALAVADELGLDDVGARARSVIGHG